MNNNLVKLLIFIAIFVSVAYVRAYGSEPETTITFQKSIGPDEYDIRAAEKVAEENKYIQEIMDRTGLEYEAAKAAVYNCRRKDLPISVLLGLYDTESDFNPKALNRGSGARGLGQILPGTARGLCSRFGREYNKAKLIEPTYNIELTTDYLVYLKAKHGTNWYKVIYWYGERTDKYTKGVLKDISKYKDLERGN